MNDIQVELARLRQQGWTLVAIAESLGVAHSTVKKWSAGMRYPANAQVVKAALRSLLEKEPGRRRNPKPS